MSILVVDDIEQNRYMLSVLLESEGYDVVVASNGEEALDYAKQQQPELIVSDILMPVMDGFKLCRQWKTDPDLRHIPFVFYTATYVESDDRALALSLGADRFLIKPLEHQQLAEEIINVIRSGVATHHHLQSSKLENQDFYEKYNKTLVHKLGKKATDLEQKNAVLLKKEVALNELNQKLELQLQESIRVQAAIRLSEERFDLAVRGSSDGIWDWNTVTDEVYYSPQFMELLGVDVSAAGGVEKSRAFFENRIHFDDVDVAQVALQAHLQDRKPYDIEFRVHTDHDDYRWFHAKGQALWDEGDGKPLRMVGSISDITSPKQLRQQLQQAQKIEAIGQLTGGIAHDFNNILAAVLGFTELSLEACKGDDNGMSEYLNEVLLAGCRARDLIAQMLVYSRGSISKPQVLDVVPQVEEIIKMLRASIPATVDIVLDCEENLPSILCDPVHLHQLVINLCVNARDALEGHGCINVRISKNSYTQQYCASCHELIAAEYLQLSVTDGAQGIKSEVMERMFDNFFTTKDVGKGTGMGLSTVHGIMHEIDGHILVESRQGEGTTFRLLFPWVEDNACERTIEPLSSKENYASLTGKVLVIDDEVSLMRLAEEFLESWGCDVMAVSSVQEALLIANENPGYFDLIITDYTMPGMNGAELLHEVKRSQSDMKAIMWSGFNEEIDAERAREFGVDIYLDKPVSPSHLFESVKSLLQ